MKHDEFFASATHEEALARIAYLVDQGRALGLLLGPAGSGKSRVLDHSARMCARAGHAVALVSALGVSPAEFLFSIASQWQGPVTAGMPLFALWQAVRDAVYVQQAEARRGVLIVDDAGEARGDVLEACLKLLCLRDSLSSKTTIVLASKTEHLPCLGERLLRRVELTSELEPLDIVETRAYLTPLFAHGDAAIDTSVAQRFHELSAGLPRRLDQLARLVMVAGQGHGQIDAGMVEAVYRELSLCGERDA